MERRSTAEIARDIMSALQEATSAVLVTEVEVREMIDRLRSRAQKPPRLGYKTDNKKYAKKVIKWINEGQKLYASRPPGLPDLLSWPGPFVPTGRFEHADFYKEAGPYHTGVANTLEEAERLNVEPAPPLISGLEHVFSILGGVRQECERIINTKQGVHHNAGARQCHAAFEAQSLALKHKLTLAYSSPTSAYRTIARLFFEAIAERPLNNGEDIERACEIVARRFPRGGIDLSCL
jgi:hypothetical protein